MVTDPTWVWGGDIEPGGREERQMLLDVTEASLCYQLRHAGPPRSIGEVVAIPDQRRELARSLAVEIVAYLDSKTTEITKALPTGTAVRTPENIGLATARIDMSLQRWSPGDDVARNAVRAALAGLGHPSAASFFEADRKSDEKRLGKR